MPFSQIGGLRVGEAPHLNVTWPFARLRITETDLIASGLGKTWTFPKSSIRSLRKYRGLFSTGLRIDSGTGPGLFVFWTFGFAALKRELERLGYTVSPGEDRLIR
jgi:hypothetical protein